MTEESIFTEIQEQEIRHIVNEIIPIMAVYCPDCKQYMKIAKILFGPDSIRARCHKCDADFYLHEEKEKIG